jgi:hypothetical protein
MMRSGAARSAANTLLFISGIRCYGGGEGGALVGREGSVGMPQDAALLVNQHCDHLTLARYLQAVTEAVLIDIERDDPGPGFRIGFVAAHGRVFPPAENKVFWAGNRQAIPAEIEVGVLKAFGNRHPGVYLGLLLGPEGDQQEIDLPGEIARQKDPGFIESVGRDRRKNGRLHCIAILSTTGDGQKKREEGKASKNFCPIGQMNILSVAISSAATLDAAEVYLTNGNSHYATSQPESSCEERSSSSLFC